MVSPEARGIRYGVRRTQASKFALAILALWFGLGGEIRIKADIGRGKGDITNKSGRLVWSGD